MERSFNLKKGFDLAGPISDKAALVMSMFGLTRQRIENKCITHKTALTIRPGDVCFVTGASGSGKSVLIRELYESYDDKDKINLDDISFADSRRVVDCLDKGMYESLRLLGRVGLSDCFAVLNKPVNLSEGERYRFALSMAINSGRKVIFADEFCSNLDRITAASVAYKIAEYARANKLTLILASSHDDIISDLSPDVIVVKFLTGKSKTVYKNPSRR